MTAVDKGCGVAVLPVAVRRAGTYDGLGETPAPGTGAVGESREGGEDVPRVSVVIPVYNHEEFVAEAVGSALNQTYRDLEVIVVDDGSTDGTPAKVAAFADRIRSFRKANGGTASALNLGIREARGELIAWLSSDDVFLPEKIDLQVRYLDAHPHVGLCYTDFYVIDARGAVTGEVRCTSLPNREAWTRALLSQGCLINGSTTLIRRNLLAEVGGFDESLPQAHDLDLWIRLSLRTEFGHIPQSLVKYRWHHKNLSRGPDALAYTPRVLEKARQMGVE
ncbi:MAG: glycosyltransferase [Clostridia bacterium]|nr:glycosyltransferase [Clostridia bacterium]